MKYIAVIRQEGEGCDYTIGCGLQVVELNATNHDAALEELRTQFGLNEPDEVCFDVDDIKSVKLYGFSEMTDVQVKAWRAEKKTREDAAAAREKEDHERAELERLSRKYQTR